MVFRSTVSLLCLVFQPTIWLSDCGYWGEEGLPSPSSAGEGTGSRVCMGTPSPNGRSAQGKGNTSFQVRPEDHSGLRGPSSPIRAVLRAGAGAEREVVIRTTAERSTC